jgi:hypothetical protein
MLPRPLPEAYVRAIAEAGLERNADIDRWLRAGNPERRFGVLRDMPGFALLVMNNADLTAAADDGFLDLSRLASHLSDGRSTPNATTMLTLSRASPVKNLRQPVSSEIWKALDGLPATLHPATSVQWRDFYRNADLAEDIALFRAGDWPTSKEVLAVMLNLVAMNKNDWSNFGTLSVDVHYNAGQCWNGFLRPLARAATCRLARQWGAAVSGHTLLAAESVARECANRMSDAAWQDAVKWSSNHFIRPSHDWLRFHELPPAADGAQLEGLLPARTIHAPPNRQGRSTWTVDVAPISNGKDLLEIALKMANCIAAETPGFLHSDSGNRHLLLLRSHTGSYPREGDAAAHGLLRRMMRDFPSIPRAHAFSVAELTLKNDTPGIGMENIGQHTTLRNAKVGPVHRQALKSYIETLSVTPAILYEKRSEGWKRIGGLSPLGLAGTALGFNPYHDDQFEHFTRVAGFRLTAGDTYGKTGREIRDLLHLAPDDIAPHLQETGHSPSGR